MANLSLISEQLITLLFIIVCMLFTPLIFIGLDYWAGIRKAKKRGEPIVSDKMKNTVDKISRYYNAILAMMVLDAIQMAAFVFLYMYNGWDAYTFPLFTLLAVVFVAAIEIKSIVEPADIKEKRERKEVLELAREIVSHKGDPTQIANVIVKYLENEKKSDFNEDFK